MSTTMEKLERSRANLGELIAAAAAELEATETNAAQAVEDAAVNAYQRGMEAGQSLGRDAMKAEVLAIIEPQIWQLQDDKLSGRLDQHRLAVLARLRALMLAIKRV